MSLLLITTGVHAEPSQPPSPKESLFQLDDELFSGLEPLESGQQPEGRPAKDPAPEAAPASTGDARDDLDAQREQGEDLGDASERGPLRRVARTMQRVEQRLAAADAAARTQELQSRIVRDLDELLAQLRAQSRQKSGASPQRAGSPTPTPGRPGPPQDGSQSQADGPATQSATRRAVADPELAAQAQATRDQLLEKAWGDLPPNERQQLRSARPEKFLPKYSQLIEAYFQRLAEENQ